MRAIGFSTGALAKGDFDAALEIQASRSQLRGVELSALRDHELPRLAAAVPRLNIAHYTYVSVHAPGKLASMTERDVFETLRDLPRQWPIIVHPELAATRDWWRSLGARLCLENMDNRKAGGRTVDEMRALFDDYPEASFCLDLGHARQVDPTMATAVRMAREFSDRLRQIHLSEVGPRGEHLPLSFLATYAFQLVAPLVPSGCPIIIESVVPESKMDCEIRKATELFGSRRSGPRSAELSLDLACP
jgi:hypothetical protein